MKIKEIASKENLKYGLFFIFLSIVFWKLYPRLIRQYTIEISKSMPYPPTFLNFFTLNGILLLSLRIIERTPYILFIYRRKYETFLFGFLIPSVVVYIYTFSTFGSSFIALPPQWSFWYLISAFVLIYLLKGSKNVKWDIFSIIFFCMLNCISAIFLHFVSLYQKNVVTTPFLIPFNFDIVARYIVFALFTALYLILLSFVVEKIAKVKIFRHGL